MVAERPRIPCPPVGPGKHSGRRANDWLALELLPLLSVLLCVQQLQLPWVIDWLARELLLLLSVLLCVQQLQLPWVLDWFARELPPLPRCCCACSSCSCRACPGGSHSSCCRCQW